MSGLSEEGLRVRLVQSEDPWVERKQSFNEQDVRRTVVAFANTVPEGQVAVLFIGAHNRGEHKGLPDADDTQKKINGCLERCYPRIRYQTKVLVVEVAGASKEILAVMVPFSANRPHFAGPAYIRRGSETIEASSEVFQDLIASQNDMARRILSFKGQPVRLRVRSESGFWYELDPSVESCDAHSVTLRDGISVLRTFPLTRIDLETTMPGRPLKILATTEVTERAHLMEMVRLWAPLDPPQRPTEYFLHHDDTVTQLLADPAKSIPVVRAVKSGRSNHWLMLLLIELRLAENGRTHGGSAMQKRRQLDGEVAKSTQGQVFSPSVVLGATVHSIPRIASSIAEANELLVYLRESNAWFEQVPLDSLWNALAWHLGQ